MVEEPKRNGWAWPDEPAGPPPTRAWRSRGALVSGVFLIYLAAPISQVYSQPHPVGVRLTVVALVLLYAGVFFVMYARIPWYSRRVRVVAVVVMSACGITFAVLLGPDDLVYMNYAISAALVQLPPLSGLFLGIGATSALLIGTTVTEGSPDWLNVSILVVLTIALYGTRQVVLANAQLRAARDEIATLAIAEERARMARDLHDVLGHSLTTITVKAGLARRILESSGDGRQAIVELRDVEQLSRTALAEVRSTVSGYRKASLPAELVGARVALQAAEIEADLPQAVDNVPASLQEPFAYVLREAVTNVIRHADASHCSVRLGESWIEIRDDGDGGGVTGSGHGLAGLEERLAKVGGSLTAGPDPDGGFVVRASVPVAVSA